ncbi:hypothetical protein LZK98_16210 [Sphingomonas cannabina]|uniref:hypothetical protein n=1 Tax=Sphingomonas cannabina TaxID=2899123 RepID=UPI001F1C1CB0|nr:hypothetical protein [Sphingomonas cannabina]UIJ44588.1 hypothetical protein LZK98_16210 [Sphingomonas cannabina]
MPEERPSNRRLGSAAVLVVGIVLLIVVAIFVTFNISHYKDARNEQTTANSAAPAR